MLKNDERLKMIMPPLPGLNAYYAVDVREATGGYVIVRTPIIAWGLVETYYEEEEGIEGHPFDQRVEQSVRPVVIGELGHPVWMTSDEGLVHVGEAHTGDERGLYEMTDFLNSHGQLILTREFTGIELKR